MTNDEKQVHCQGCRDDFYNRGEKRCWSLDDAKMVRRWETGTWTDPTKPGAFTEVETLNCFNASGRHFTASLPQCAVEPIRLAGSPTTGEAND
jgi:hypothetical protein